MPPEEVWFDISFHTPLATRGVAIKLVKKNGDIIKRIHDEFEKDDSIGFREPYRLRISPINGNAEIDDMYFVIHLFSQEGQTAAVTIHEIDAVFLKSKTSIM